MDYEYELLSDLDSDVVKLAIGWSRDNPNEIEDIAQEARVGIIQEYRRNPNAPRHHLFRRAKHEILDYRKKGKSVDGKLDKTYKRDFVWGMVSRDAFPDYVAASFASPYFKSRQQHPTEDEAVTRVTYEELVHCLNSEEEQYVSLKLQGYSRSEARMVMGITPYEERQMLGSLHTKVEEAFCLDGC